MRRGGFAIILALLAIAAVIRVLTGPAAEGDAIRMSFGVPASDIFKLRADAVLGASLVGAALGLAGLALQVLLRNPLADPFVLGVSGGAGFGVSVVLVVAYLFAIPAGDFGGEAGGAVIGAGLTLGLVLWLGRSSDGHDPTRLVLAGVIVGAIFASATMLLQQMVPYGLRGDLVSWMAGRLPEMPRSGSLAVLLTAVVGGGAFLLFRARALDVACLSEDEARTSGLDVLALRRELFLVGGVLAAMAVAYAGPIGFVGLIAPHAARRLAGATHRALVPASAAAGATLLVAADCVRQFIDVGTGRLAIGVVTALAGGPAFLWLLRRARWNA